VVRVGKLVFNVKECKLKRFHRYRENWNTGMSTAGYSNSGIYLWLRVSFQKTIFSSYMAGWFFSFTLARQRVAIANRYRFLQSVAERNSRNTSALKHIYLILSTTLLSLCHLFTCRVEDDITIRVSTSANNISHRAFRVRSEENKIVDNHDEG